MSFWPGRRFYGHDQVLEPRCPCCGARSLLVVPADDGYPEAQCLLCGQRAETAEGRAAREDALVLKALAQDSIKRTGYLRDQHVRVLFHLHKEARGLCHDEVSRLTRLNETTVKQALTYLAQRGLVAQLRGSRREKAHYSLTEQGQELWSDFRASQETLNADYTRRGRKPSRPSGAGAKV